MFEVEEKYMARCLEIARGGQGETSPNPMVGAVIVYNNRIIGEGFHRRIGKAHAEVNAIDSVKDHSLLQKATMYVSLEPCSHYGKTPPCAELIISKKIPRVVVGCPDPYPEVSWRGIRMMQAAGIEVVTGVLEKEARELNKAFITFQEKRRPYITLKWAQSADGFIDKLRTDNSQPPVKFSTSEMRRIVHKLRSETAAIMVGTHTALLDNPSLKVRHWPGRSPVRIVIDRELRIPDNFQLMDGSSLTLVLTARQKENRQNVEYIPTDFFRPLLPQVLELLYNRKLNSLLVEGGTNLLNQFLEQDLWDEIQIETAPFNLTEGVKAPQIPQNFSEVNPENIRTCNIRRLRKGQTPI